MAQVQADAAEVEQISPEMQIVMDGLARGSKSSDEQFASLRCSLQGLRVCDLKLVAKNLNVRLTGASRKNDIVERLIAMAQIDATRRNETGDAPLRLTYIDADVREVLKSLPSFDSVTEGWSKDFKAVLVEFHFMHLLTYLVYGRDKTFDMDSMRAFRSLKGYRFFVDGFVKNVWTHAFPEKNGVAVTYVRSYVHHSMSCDPSLQVFVALNSTKGDVYSAQCNCVAGLGQACNHIAAVLFYLEDAKKKRLDKLPVELSKTSQPMVWNQPPKKQVDPSPLNDICRKQSDSSADRQERWSYDPRRPQDQGILKPTLQRFLDGVKQQKKTKSGVLQFWNIPESASVATLGTDEEVLSLVLFSPESAAHAEEPVEKCPPTEEECAELADAMTLSHELAEKVEAMTRKQSECQLWHLLHNGRITSSRFGEIRRRRATTSADRLVRDLMGYKHASLETYLPASIRWGRDNEPRARIAYVRFMKNSGRNVQVRECGLHLDREHSYLGASSDGRVVDSSLENDRAGCLEIKCPFSVNCQSVVEMTPADIAKKFPQQFCLACEDGQLQLRKGHPYYDQIMGEMAIIGVHWCDFVVYTSAGIFVERITFDQFYWENTLFPCLKNFYVSHMVPELVCNTLL